MDAIKAIMTRRSIRKYTDEPVTEEEVQILLKAAMAAPSAGNKQPGYFIIIDNHYILNEITRFHPNAKMLSEAQLAIAVCGDETKELAPGYWIQDCSAATENILLAAHAIGLGAVWLGIYPRGDRIHGATRLLNLPEHIHPLCLISIGRPAEKKEIQARYDESRIFRNEWNKI